MRIQDSPDVTNNQSVINIALALVREIMLYRTIRKWHIGDITRQFPNLNYMFKPRVIRQYNWMSQCFKLADVQEYGSGCMVLDHALGVCVYAG